MAEVIRLHALDMEPRAHAHDVDPMVHRGAQVAYDVSVLADRPEEAAHKFSQEPATLDLSCRRLGCETLSYRRAAASAIQALKAAGNEQPWEERHDRARYQSRQLVFSTQPAHAQSPGADVRRQELDLCRDAGSLRSACGGAAGGGRMPRRSRGVHRLQSAGVLRCAVRDGAPGCDLRAAQLPADRARAQIHHQRCRRSHDRRRQCAPRR